jgi:hypothetical protein
MGSDPQGLTPSGLAIGLRRCGVDYFAGSVS